MASEMVTIPKKEYDALLESVGTLRNRDMVRAIRESEEAKKSGVTPWKLHV